MELLIDTHAVIWFISDNPKLSSRAKDLIEDKNNTCWVSMASLWEMAIKYALDRLDLKTDLENIFHIIDRSGFLFMPISAAHILQTTTLEFHHRDPFDRLIVAQGLSEDIRIVSKDRVLQQYEVHVEW